jgi:hypothetical protein
MIVTDVGSLEIGTTANPIAANVTAELRFTNTDAINRDWDPFGISRGLITHGSVSMVGGQKTPSLEIVNPITAGTSSLVLSQVPANWRVGDYVVVAGTSIDPNQSEVRAIRAIIGNTIFVDPLSYSHLTGSSSQQVHVANTTRNILISSETSTNSRRGHVMFMHNPNVHISNVHFYRLGRTNKAELINDPVVDANWNLVSGTGTNPRARYAVHFHRTGTDDSTSPATVDGSVVSDNLGWGFVNHSSYVNFTNNVAYNVRGAGFVTEVGDEIGAFRNNVAINIKASGDSLKDLYRLAKQDFGHTGDGFWFQGAGISVVGNVAANAEGHAFIYSTRALELGDEPVGFLASNLLDPSIANGAATIPVDFVPVFEFTGNVGYSSGVGLSVWYNLRNATHTAQSTFSNSLFWNNGTGVEVPYTHNAILRNLRIERDASSPGTVGVDSNGVTKNITYDNLTVSGYDTGIETAKRGYSIINGGTFATRVGVSVRPAVEPGRYVYVQGNLVMVPLPAEMLIGWTQRAVNHRFEDNAQNDSIAHIFYDSKVFLNYGPYANQQLYAGEQMASAVPFPTAKPYIPTEYVGLTTAQLRDQFGSTVYGELAPAEFLQIPSLGGLLQIPG